MIAKLASRTEIVYNWECQKEASMTLNKFCASKNCKHLILEWITRGYGNSPVLAHSCRLAGVPTINITKEPNRCPYKKEINETRR